MRLTKTTSHAIRILIDCAQSGDELIKVAEIAKRLEISRVNVFKIVHLLSRAGFIVAMRGRNGGVRLARPARDIRIGDVVRATEVTRIEVEGAQKRASPRRRAKSGPRLNSIFDEALGAFISVLDRHTLEEMARGKAPAASAASAHIRRKQRRGSDDSHRSRQPAS